MSNLDDYNWGKTVGPAGGPPTSIGGFIGQQEYQRDNAPRPGNASSVSRPASGSGKPPDWLVTNPIRRGFALVVVAHIILFGLAFAGVSKGTSEVIGAGAILIGFFGLLWMFGGLIAFVSGFVSGRSRKSKGG